MSDSKPCSEADASVLITQNSHRVSYGERAAIIQVNRWNDMATGPHCLVSLDSDSTVEAPLASAEAHEVIKRLFPEFVEGDTTS